MLTNKSSCNAGDRCFPASSTRLSQSLGVRADAGVPFTVPMAYRNSLRQKVPPICETCWRSRFVELRIRKLDPKLANSINYLGTCFLRAIEVADIQARLESLVRQQGIVSDLAYIQVQTRTD